MLQFFRRHVPLTLIVIACGCNSSKSDTKGTVAQEKGATPTVNAAAAAKPADDAMVKLALGALQSWVDAQNQNKLDGYLGLYDAASFQGIKRTTSGTEQKQNFDAWKQERSRMFGTGVTVAADAPKAASVGPDMVEVRFTQRWKNPRYADHGPKVMRFKVKNGAARIVYEELVSSTPGWEDASADTGLSKFVRPRPEHSDRKGLDACAYLGGFGFACVDALLAEKDPIVKRYMRRLSDADARQAFDALQAKSPNGVAHAEFAMQCADKGPCKADAAHSDDGYMCLTRAENAIQQGNEAESKAAHERACTCGSERAQIPIMGGFLACNGKTPEKRGQDMTSAEAKEVRACGECDAQAGPAACAKEIERLSKSDAELAKYIETVHVPRCSRP